MKVLKAKYFPACYIKVNYPRILVDFMAVKPNNKTMMMLFLVGYLGLQKNQVGSKVYKPRNLAYNLYCLYC